MTILALPKSSQIPIDWGCLKTFQIVNSLKTILLYIFKNITTKDSDDIKTKNKDVTLTILMTSMFETTTNFRGLIMLFVIQFFGLFDSIVGTVVIDIVMSFMEIVLWSCHISRSFGILIPPSILSLPASLSAYLLDTILWSCYFSRSLGISIPSSILSLVLLVFNHNKRDWFNFIIQYKYVF